MTISVAMVMHDFYPSVGGAQTHTLALSRKLRARGVEVIVITRAYPGMPRYEEVQGIPTYRVGVAGGRALAGLSYLADGFATLVRERRRYQIVHCHQMISPMTLALAARVLPGKRLVINPHGRGPRGDVGKITRLRPLTGKMRVQAALRLGDAFVAIASDIRDELRGIGVPAERIWEIANGVDVERFAPASPLERAALRSTYRLPAGPLVIYAGRLVSIKGPDVLLEAWARAGDALAGARLVLVGDGEQRPALEAQARQLGLGDRVVFAGSQGDPAPLLRAADAFVLPSRSEGLPVALLEAMACALPCVATRVGGSAELIEDGVSGRLVAPESPEELGAAIADSLRAGASWGARARQRILDRYELGLVADRYVELYAQLLAGAAARGGRSETRAAG